MDFNLKALGAETVMVDRRIVAQLAEAELLLRDGEKTAISGLSVKTALSALILQSVYSRNVPSPVKMLNALE